ncbi:LysR substrate-binding domain-containing protein [Vreelandella alkaliphila]|uniref:LysR family transcriptional regulator n=1 Tax=Vreelandella alkaliphila TaxID=272774 RepID=A0ABX4HI64_9GAMM|nr:MULTISPECIES: LysR substrate-binding domain-containing protein [Halomonas]MCD6437034.1 LysR family transcriptional regulator [Halomonas sp.]PAU72023.1 LysR family transcriptional regulator [Halomonas humidisoli]
MARDLSLRKLRYFMAVAKSGRVTQAAVDLNVSQSSITTGVKEIEEQIGVALFRRTSRGMTLTREGTRFLQRVNYAFQALDDAFEGLTDTRPTLKGTLRLAMTYTVAGYFMPPLLAQFQRRYPWVKVELHEVSRPDIEQGLASGEFDLAIVLTSNIEHHQWLEKMALTQSRRRLWVNGQHELLKRESITLKDIAHYPYIMLTVDEADQTALKYWKPEGITPNILFRTSSVEAVRSMVANGTGVTILSDMVYRPWSLDGKRIEHIELSNPIPPMELGLSWPRNRPLSPAAKAFCDLAQGFSI